MIVLFIIDLLFESLTTYELFNCSQTKWASETIGIILLPLFATLIISIKGFTELIQKYTPVSTNGDVESDVNISASKTPGVNFINVFCTNVYWQLLSSYMYVVKAAKTMFVRKNIDEIDGWCEFQLLIHQHFTISFFL